LVFTHKNASRVCLPEQVFFCVERSGTFFNNLSFELLNLRRPSYGNLKFVYFFKMHYYFIACCTRWPMRQ